MLTEQIEPLPEVPSQVRKPPALQHGQPPQTKPETQEKPVKPKVKGGRAKGRVSTPERKPARKEPVFPREEVKKKKGLRGHSVLVYTAIVVISISLCSLLCRCVSE